MSYPWAGVCRGWCWDSPGGEDSPFPNHARRHEMNFILHPSPFLWGQNAWLNTNSQSWPKAFHFGQTKVKLPSFFDRLVQLPSRRRQGGPDVEDHWGSRQGPTRHLPDQDSSTLLHVLTASQVRGEVGGERSTSLQVQTFEVFFESSPLLGKVSLADQEFVFECTKESSLPGTPWRQGVFLHAPGVCSACSTWKGRSHWNN